jgi:hypothetical protein
MLAVSEWNTPAMVVGMILGALLDRYLPRAWREAVNADRIEAMTRSGPLRRRKP